MVAVALRAIHRAFFLSDSVLSKLLCNAFSVVRCHQGEKMDLDSAVDEAFDEMLDGFLMMNKAEVKNMFLTEYNEEKVLEQ